MTSAPAITFDLAGQTLWPLPQRALFWPQQQALLIADLHLGKSQVFRQAGIALPQGDTQQDLARLTLCIEQTQARVLWILGDLLHGAMPSVDSDDLMAWHRWREQHAQLDVHVVRGNHDRALDASILGVRLHDRSVSQASLRLQHEPPAAHAPPGLVVVCGHRHPVDRLPGLPGRWPAFHLSRRVLVLPAFSAFTGGQAIQRRPGDQVALSVRDTHLVRRL